MTGITSYGAYIPIYRLGREAINAAWGKGGGRGERSVANHDEDSMTMAVEAGIDCINGMNRQDIGGLFFASTTSPYKEKQGATLISTAVDLNPEILTADFTNSLRAGSSALRSAMDAVQAGSAKRVLVTASDCRLGYPKSAHEASFGDGAAALLVGDSGVIATLEGAYSLANEIIDNWRADEQTFVNSWEGRFVTTHGYTENMRKAISGVMKKCGLEPKDFAKVAFSGPDARTHSGLAKGLGFDVKTQLQDPLLATVGDTGAAHGLMVLVAALEEAKPGDKILFASYGDGADAFVFQVTDEITKLRGRRGIKAHLASKMTLPSYSQYLLYRKLLGQPQENFNSQTAATMLWRDRNWVLRFHGSKCKKCGMVTFPPQRVCYGCQAKDEYEEIRLSDKKGKVFSFTLDNLAGGPAAPTPHTVIESEEGNARIYAMMTDFDTKDVRIDLPVEMTFRWIWDARGYHNYFWKCRPIREGGN